MAITTRTLATLVFVLAGSLLGIACDRPPGSPTAPTSVAWQPPSGAIADVPFTLPGTNEPMHFWIIGVNPTRGTSVKTGQQTNVQYTISGPSGGFQVYMSDRFVTQPKQPGDDECGLGEGHSEMIKPKSDGTGSHAFTIPAGVQSLDAYRVFIWTSPQTPTACPDPSHIYDFRLDMHVAN